VPATNVFNSIASAWAADAVLNALIPSDRISNTRAEDATNDGTDQNVPYVIVEQIDDTRSGRSSRGDEWVEQIQITVYVEDLGMARRVQKEYRRVFDAPFKPTIDDGQLIDWQRMSGGRAVEEGAIGKAMDTYFLTKRTIRS
jgi:hypothetical protein